MKDWKHIKTADDFYAIIEKSEQKTQIIFKDSVSCGISAHAKERLTQGNDVLIEKADFNYLDLLSYRDISALIAKELNVIHQSPQIIVVKNKKPVYDVTHHSIDANTIAANL